MTPAYVGSNPTGSAKKEKDGYIIDGEKLKADTFYKLQDGEFVEVEEDSK